MDGILWWLVQALVGAFATVLWSMNSDTKAKIEKLDDDFANYKIESAARWVTRDEMERVITSINQTLERNADRLDTRLDRLEERVLETRRRNDSREPH